MNLRLVAPWWRMNLRFVAPWWRMNLRFVAPWWRMNLRFVAPWGSHTLSLTWTEYLLDVLDDYTLLCLQEHVIEPFGYLNRSLKTNPVCWMPLELWRRRWMMMAIAMKWTTSCWIDDELLMWSDFWMNLLNYESTTCIHDEGFIPGSKSDALSRWTNEWLMLNEVPSDRLHYLPLIYRKCWKYLRNCWPDRMARLLLVTLVSCYVLMLILMITYWRN